MSLIDYLKNGDFIHLKKSLFKNGKVVLKHSEIVWIQEIKKNSNKTILTVTRSETGKGEKFEITTDYILGCSD